MIDNYLNMRKNRTKSHSWIWFILLKCAIVFPCISSECLGVNLSVSMYPAGTITVIHGEPLEIFCVTENYTSEDLEFSINDKYFESEKINDTTRRLFIQNPEKQMSSYYCRNKKTAKACVSRVVVDTPPMNITDISCVSTNLDKLYCSWTYPATYTHINYNVTFILGGIHVMPPCVAKTNNILGTNIGYCTWTTTTKPRYRQLEKSLTFSLRGCNVLGCNDQTFTLDHYSIVKPDPPFNLKVVNIGSKNVTLEWNIPNNMIDILPSGVEHEIEYRIVKVGSTMNFINVNASMLRSKNANYRFQLINLPYAYTEYEVRIRLKTKEAVKHEYWSDFNYKSFYTASERPERPPETIAGAFDQGIINNKRLVYIYWKQLEEDEKAGASFTYKVLLSQGNKTFPIIYSDKSFIETEVPFEALDVTIWSVNENGPSVNSSRLYIPRYEDTQSFHVTSLTKVSYENGTYALHWLRINDVDNYTLFWCPNVPTTKCLRGIEFEVLDPKQNHRIIHLPTEYDYQFAISANSDTKTSGMVWAKCDISTRFGTYSFPANLRYDPPGKTFVLLRLWLSCPLQDTIITDYNISYCPIVHTSMNCDKSYEIKTKFISNPKQMDVLVENLLPSTTYKFNLAINTIYGLKSTDQATLVITTQEDS